MLLTQALVRMLELWQDGSLNGVCEELFRDRVPIILTQIAIRTLQSIENHRESPEMTTYAVLTLTKLSSLPWLRTLGTDVSVAVEAGGGSVRTIMNNLLVKQEPLWIDHGKTQSLA